MDATSSDKQSVRVTILSRPYTLLATGDPREVERVAKAARREQRRSRPLALEDRVRDERRAVDTELHIGYVGAYTSESGARPGLRPDLRRLRGCQHLLYRERTGIVDDHHNARYDLALSKKRNNGREGRGCTGSQRFGLRRVELVANALQNVTVSRCLGFPRRGLVDWDFDFR